jgi:hypothetical protein
MGTPLDITSFDLKNTDGKAVIYRTSDPSLNRLTFTIINTTGADLPLTGGAPNVGSTFTIDFSSILPDPVVESLAIALPAGWARLFEPGTETEPPAWALAPAADVTLKPGESVKFDISKIVLESYDSGNFEIQWSKVPGQSDSASPLTIWVGIINPPDPKKKDLTLHYGYTNVSHTINNQSFSEPDGEVIDAAADGTPVEIFITYDTKALIFNGFTFYLTNSSADKIPADTTPGTGTVLSISFLIGELSYDITNRERAVNQMTLGVASREPPWKLDAKTPGSGLITFKFKPGSAVFLAGRQTLYLDVQAIITALNVDPGTISTMYAQINNVPGYNDAVFFLALEKKVAKAIAVSFGAVPTTINYGQNVSLSWETELAKRVTIEYKDRNGKEIILDSDKGEIPLNSGGFSPSARPSAQLTLFSLSAYGNSATPSRKQCWVQVQWPPKILSFSSDRRLVDLTGETEINLSWKIENDASKLMLEALGVVHDVTGQPSCSYKITTSTVFKLKAYGYYPEPDTSTTTVFAYKQDLNMELEFTGVARQSWPVVLTSRVGYYPFVLAVDAGAQKFYWLDASTGKRIKYFDSSVMAVNPKETNLFVCIKHRVSMSDFRVMWRSAHTMLSGAVRAMVSNDSDTLLCCAMTDGRKVALIKIDSPFDGPLWLGPPTYIPVGDYPISMVFNDDSSMLYVANYGSNSISLIRLSDNSVTNINLTASKPNSMVYQKALRRLFVACEGEDKVAMIESSNNAVTYIKTGAMPSRLLFNPNQDILYVTNFLDNTVSVIDPVNGGAKLPPLTVGEGPLGMALNAHRNLLLVCNYCSRTLSLIELPGHHVLPEQLPTGGNSGNPLGLALLEGNDHTKVFVGKENFPGRPCRRPPSNTSLSVAAYSIQKPRMPGDL